MNAIQRTAKIRSYEQKIAEAKDKGVAHPLTGTAPRTRTGPVNKADVPLFLGSGAHLGKGPAGLPLFLGTDPQGRTEE